MGKIVTVPFHGTDLLAITTETGPPLVPLPPLVEGMGLDWPSQLKRAKRDAILSPSMVMMTMESGREAWCLPLDLIPGFLFRIDAARVDETIRSRVVDYQRECFRVLAAACFGPQPTPIPIDIAPPEVGRALNMVREARRSFGTASARELWLRLGLPVVPAMRAVPRQGSLFGFGGEG